jgi:GR25 family glycosyltransferase involved in LPS biosynthesis
LAIILEDDVKIYNNFNKIIDTIYENLPVKFDYVHLFIHPDKQNILYLEGKDGDIIPAEDNFGTVAYIISLRGAKRLVKLTELLKIQAPVDRQINFCIRHNFIKAFMVKKPFLLTQGEIMPNRGIYDNSFKSTIWYSKKLKDTKKIREEFIKLAGFTEEDVEKIDLELNSSKKKNEDVKNEEELVVIKKIEVDLPVESEKEKQKGKFDF